MPYTAFLRFDPFVCDIGNACLRRGEQVIRLTPKAFAVLSYLAERAGQLAAKDQILQAVWPETTLSETVLAVAIRELRRALQDSARTPRFIETVHRRGYRFIATLQTSPGRPPPSSTMSLRAGSPLCIGHNIELTRLDQWLLKSLGSECQREKYHEVALCIPESLRQFIELQLGRIDEFVGLNLENPASA